MNSMIKRACGILICLIIPFGISAVVIYDVPGKVKPEQMESPMVVEFYSPTCPHCNQMAPIYEKIAQKCKNNVHFYKVNITSPHGIDLANQIAQEPVSGIPTFVFVSKSGTRNVHTGGLSMADLQTRIDQLCPKER